MNDTQVMMNIVGCKACVLTDESLLTLFLFKSFTQELAFHLNVFFQRPLTLSKVTQVSVGKLPLLLPEVTIAQSYTCGNIIAKHS